MSTDMNAASVLLVEDDEEIRRFVRTALKAEGFRVYEADTMSAGLVEAGTRKPEHDEQAEDRQPPPERAGNQLFPGLLGGLSRMFGRKRG